MHRLVDDIETCMQRAESSDDSPRGPSTPLAAVRRHAARDTALRRRGITQSGDDVNAFSFAMR
jgi:hypothetical protein